MAPNINPIFTGTPSISFSSASINTANNTADITSGSIYPVFTAGSNGSFVREVRIKAQPATSTIATVARLWINNGGSTGNSSNSSLFAELGLPATTTSSNSALPDFSIPVNVALPSSYQLILTIGTSAGSGAFDACAIGGDY